MGVIGRVSEIGLTHNTLIPDQLWQLRAWNIPIGQACITHLLLELGWGEAHLTHWQDSEEGMGCFEGKVEVLFPNTWVQETKKLQKSCL